MIGTSTASSAKAAAASLVIHMGPSGEASFVSSLQQAGLTAVTEMDVVSAPTAMSASDKPLSEKDENSHLLIIIIALCGVIVLLVGIAGCICCLIAGRPSSTGHGQMMEVQMNGVSQPHNGGGQSWHVVNAGQAGTHVIVQSSPPAEHPANGLAYAQPVQGFQQGHQAPGAPPQYAEAMYVSPRHDSGVDKD